MKTKSAFQKNYNDQHRRINKLWLCLAIFLSSIILTSAGSVTGNSGKSSLTFPREGDEPDGEGVYHYKIDSISLNGNTITSKPDDGDNEADQTFSLDGKTCIDAFIYAPDAKMGINGGGKGCSGGNPNEKYNIYGAVWVKEWGLSKSNAAGILVPDELKDGLGSDVSVFNKSGSVSTWQREEVSP
ncbi:MAG: hypothetical protein BRC49_15720 [Cyanobacteria bacterium SW_10_48_33]|nr:MAG: hypothetical protein BRC49_15720 [Cyanobacteria bacterium SW_10_48_33]